MKLRFVTGVALLLPLLGCTYPVLEAPLSYGDYGLRGGDGREVRVLAFEDRRLRPGPDECTQPATPKVQPVPGSKGVAVRDTRPPFFGPPQQQLPCRTEAPGWFAERLVLALKSAGFRVVDQQGPLTPDALEVQGTLQRLEIALVGRTIIADSWVRLQVRDGRGLSAYRSFYAQERALDSQGALDKSSQRAVRDMLAALLSLSNRYPAPVEMAAQPAITP